jgi:hypothetical protein
MTGCQNDMLKTKRQFKEVCIALRMTDLIDQNQAYG